MAAFIASRFAPAIYLKVLRFDTATNMLTVNGRFGHVWDMDVAHAKRHYQPITESDYHAIRTRLQAQLQRGEEGCPSEG